jgi:hypothetical protein
LGIKEFGNLGIKDGSIHDCDEMVVEKTSGKDKMGANYCPSGN